MSYVIEVSRESSEKVYYNHSKEWKRQVGAAYSFVARMYLVRGLAELLPNPESAYRDLLSIAKV